MIEPVTWWIEITQYNDKKAMPIVNLIQTTWLVRYNWPVEIMYDRGREILGHNFKNSFMEEEYGVNTKPYSPGNPQANAVIDIIR